MLTSALNKSPKPPIIVDDIIVTELNLGQVPPELEILEIGDLAEDRFRGIFKMSYTGDAYLTLKTRVQANPLNTYLSTKPSFASPQPLAAASSLTIPLSITLSDFRLSGFVILVFSRQKGITLVFRNDPLESLKVSSTFDSIPFVRDYLQKEIEQQLRTLFMEDLPAIIHRLSLRVFSPDQMSQEDEKQRAEENNNKEPAIDPLASPPQDPCDAFGRPLDETELSTLSPEHETVHATFSQKNLLRLAALTESHRTLSLFTPPIRDAVFRAWAGAAERGEAGNSATVTSSLTMLSLSRQNGSIASASTSAYSASAASTSSRRPSLTTVHSTYSGSQMSAPHANKTRSHAGQRKRKNRVVNLRGSIGAASTASDDTFSVDASTTSYGSRRSSLAAPSSFGYSIPDEREDDPDTPPRSPNQFKRSPHHTHGQVDNSHSPRARIASTQRLQEIVLDEEDNEPTPRARPLSFVGQNNNSQDLAAASSSPMPKTSRIKRHGIAAVQHQPASGKTYITEKETSAGSSEKARPDSGASSSSSSARQRPTDWLQRSSTGSILEQAWMVKMANQIAKKVNDEQLKVPIRKGFWDAHNGEDSADVCGHPPPPAYVA